jgi:hypothetical protein
MPQQTSRALLGGGRSRAPESRARIEAVGNAKECELCGLVALFFMQMIAGDRGLRVRSVHFLNQLSTRTLGMPISFGTISPSIPVRPSWRASCARTKSSQCLDSGWPNAIVFTKMSLPLACLALFLLLPSHQVTGHTSSNSQFFTWSCQGQGLVQGSSMQQNHGDGSVGK